MASRKSKPAATAVVQPPAPAIRLIFEYDGDEVRLVSQQPVDVAITGADLAQVQAAGTFVDTRDATNRTLARVHARGVSEGTAEVFPEKPGQPFERVNVERPKGAFTVVLPAPQAAARVAVVRVKPGAAPAARAPGGPAAEPVLEAKELGSFALQRKP
jgi:septal ring-binding cell division protein DamX